MCGSGLWMRKDGEGERKERKGGLVDFMENSIWSVFFFLFWFYYTFLQYAIEARRVCKVNQ